MHEEMKCSMFSISTPSCCNFELSRARDRTSGNVLRLFSNSAESSLRPSRSSTESSLKEPLNNVMHFDAVLPEILSLRAIVSRGSPLSHNLIIRLNQVNNSTRFNPYFSCRHSAHLQNCAYFAVGFVGSVDFVEVQKFCRSSIVCLQC